MVSVSDPHRQVVVGAASCVEAAGDGDGSSVPLDVKVLLLIPT